MAVETPGIHDDLLLRLLRRARVSFLLRAAIVMTLGTAMSCSACGTIASVAAWAGCNACAGSGSGCGGTDDGEDDEQPDEETACSDGLDDDGDGDIDCDDLDCRRSGACGEYYCYDGYDDDGDGAVDCDDSDCCDFDECRCQCEARCEAGTALCIGDRDACTFECCAAGQECVDGRCVGCANECATGYVPCWGSDELCALDCCTPGQRCGARGCECETDCAAGTAPCLADEWTCAYECCAEGDVCRAGGCTPVACAAAVAVDGASHELDLAWTELDDALDVSGLDGCVASAGAEALLDVRVPAGDALAINTAQGIPGAVHVLDACPPTRCLASLGAAASSATLWINGTDEEARILVLLEAGDDAALAGQLRVTGRTGEDCERAIDALVGDDAFSWAADSSLFDQASDDAPCGASPERLAWFTIDLDPGARLDAAAWGDDDAFAPTVAISDGPCGASACIAQGADAASVRNDLATPRTLRVAIGWSADYDGGVNVDLATSE
jgi:hypothetical protein